MFKEFWRCLGSAAAFYSFYAMHPREMIERDIEIAYGRYRCIQHELNVFLKDINTVTQSLRLTGTYGFEYEPQKEYPKLMPFEIPGVKFRFRVSTQDYRERMGENNELGK